MPNAPQIKLGNKTYDRAKPVVQIWLPALGTLYFTLSQIWGFPAAEQVVGSIAAITLFLGAVLGISSKQYHEKEDGAIVINDSDPAKDVLTFELDIPVAEIWDRQELHFKVRNESQENHGL